MHQQPQQITGRSAVLAQPSLDLSEASLQGSPDYLHTQWDQLHLQLSEAIKDADSAHAILPEVLHTGRREISVGMDGEEESRRREALALLASIQLSKQLPESEALMPSSDAGPLTNSPSGFAGETDEIDQEHSRVGCTSCWSEDALANNGSQALLQHSWHQQGATEEEEEDAESQARSRALSFSQVGSVSRMGSGLTTLIAPTDAMTAASGPVHLQSPTHAREATNAFIDGAGHHGFAEPALGAGLSQSFLISYENPRSVLHSPTNGAMTPPGYIYYVGAPSTHLSASRPLSSRGHSGVTSPIHNPLDGSQPVVLSTPGRDGPVYQILSPGMLSRLHLQQQQQHQQQQQQQQQQQRHSYRVASRRGSLQGVLGHHIPFHSDPRCAPRLPRDRSPTPASTATGLPLLPSISPTTKPLPSTDAQRKETGTAHGGTRDLRTTQGSAVSGAGADTHAPIALSANMCSFLCTTSRSDFESPSVEALAGSRVLRSSVGGSEGTDVETTPATNEDRVTPLTVPCSAALPSFLNTNPASASYPGAAPRVGQIMTPHSHPLNTHTAGPGAVSPSAEGPALSSSYGARPTGYTVENSGVGMASPISPMLPSPTLLGAMTFPTSYSTRHYSTTPDNSNNSHNNNTTCQRNAASVTSPLSAVVLGNSVADGVNTPQSFSFAASGAKDASVVRDTEPTATTPVSPTKDRAKRNVYITGLPPSWNTTKLRELCETVGNVLCAKVARDRVSNRSLCYGFVLYETDAAARACIDNFSGLRIPLEASPEHEELPLRGELKTADRDPHHKGEPDTTVLACRFAHERAAPTFGQNPAPTAATMTATTTGSIPAAPTGLATSYSAVGQMAHTLADSTARPPSMMSTLEGDRTTSLAGTVSIPLDATHGSVISSDFDNASFNRAGFSTVSLAHGPAGPAVHNSSHPTGDVLFAHAVPTSATSAHASAAWSTHMQPAGSLSHNTAGAALGDTTSSLNVTWPTVPLPGPAQAPPSAMPIPVAVPSMAPFHPIGPTGAPLPQWLPMSAAAGSGVPAGVFTSTAISQQRSTPTLSQSPCPVSGIEPQTSTTPTTNGEAAPPSASQSTHDGRRNVYVTNLPRTWNTTMLRKLCAAFGPILSASVAHHRQSNEPLGYGFVLFETPESAARCIRQLDQKVLVIPADGSQPLVVAASTCAPSPSIQQHVLTCRYAKDTAAPSWLMSPTGSAALS